MFKATAAGKSIDYTRFFFVNAHWWLFCFLIVALTFLLLAFDPLPKLFMGTQKVTCGQHCPGGSLLTGRSYTGM